MICAPDDQALSDPNVILFSLGENIDIHTLVDMVEHSDSLHRICIPTDDIEGTYKKVCAEFLEVNAGGGLVSNRRGDFLLISRNGLWDLPKGHVDPGENDGECAVREVAEETGVKGAKIVRFLCNTLHAYGVYGVWELKRTAWYELKAQSCDTKPQAEEDILQAKWCSAEEVEENLRTTYPTIRNVFAAKRG